jgi:lipopolysaccharide/colanic/teichoic acid biosynthesis glycosyltransferase
MISIPVFLITLPLWPAIALGIIFDSPGPVFYIQRRVGEHGRIFSLIKFRSMIEEAEQSGPVWAEKNDRRVTRVGRILRTLHADELPQLLNVIRGEMSLVGPRPERPEFVKTLEEQIPGYSLRHGLKPGLTGWAQVNFPYASSLKDSVEKLKFDLDYIQAAGIAMDIRILFKTMHLLFRRENKLS